MLKEISQDCQTRMGKSLDAFQVELGKLRSGRAHPSLLDHVMVNYYDNPTPLNQVATINVVDPRTLTVTPWEKNLISNVEKAILKADLGLNPATVGNSLRVPLPPLNEERRKDLIKVVRAEAENARIAVRNIRRDANHQFKELLKDKAITEDEERHAMDEMQKVTDQFIKRIDDALTHKEEELLKI
jgi:ribosome recycling factor